MISKQHNKDIKSSKQITRYLDLSSKLSGDEDVTQDTQYPIMIQMLLIKDTCSDHPDPPNCFSNKWRFWQQKLSHNLEGFMCEVACPKSDLNITSSQISGEKMYTSIALQTVRLPEYKTLMSHALQNLSTGRTRTSTLQNRSRIFYQTIYCVESMMIVSCEPPSGTVLIHL